MSISEAQRLRPLEVETAKLKQLVADLTLEKLDLQDMIAKSLKRVETRELVVQLRRARTFTATGNLTSEVDPKRTLVVSDNSVNLYPYYKDWHLSSKCPRPYLLG